MALMQVRGRENPLKALIEGLGTGMKAREDSRIKREELKIKSDRNKALAALWLAKSKAGAGKMKDLTNAELIKLTESETTPDDISSKAQAILRERMGLPPRNPETLTAPNGAAKDKTVEGANMSDAADGAKGGTFLKDLFESFAGYLKAETPSGRAVGDAVLQAPDDIKGHVREYFNAENPLGRAVGDMGVKLFDQASELRKRISHHFKQFGNPLPGPAPGPAPATTPGSDLSNLLGRTGTTGVPGPQSRQGLFGLPTSVADFSHGFLPFTKGLPGTTTSPGTGQHDPGTGWQKFYTEQDVRELLPGQNLSTNRVEQILRELNNPK